MLHGVLPCYGVFSGRHIRTPIQCLICSLGPEDIQHCLFKCARVKDVWKDLGLYDDVRKAVMQDRSGSVTLEILAKMQSVTGDLPSAELTLLAAWFLWWQRRQLVRGESVQNAERSVVSIKVLLTNFMRAANSKSPKCKLDQMWKKPSKGFVKINVDASFVAETLSGTSGAVARDENGNFIAAASWLMPHVPNVDSAKMTVIRNGFYLAASIGCSKLIFKSDSSFVVDAMKGENDYAGPSIPMMMES